ncbi:MAG: TetR/AcrR family transcriptional regulator [Bacteroidales bacterium]|nr:TetR/AcrR family transcriptional regulator [Bacteroidales bacterium]
MEKTNEIRQEILKVAQRIFSHYGFGKTTMELIAKEAGKGKSTLYYYFKSKEEIYASVIENEGNFIQNELLKIINSAGDTKTIFRKYSLKRFELAKIVVNYFNVVKDEYLTHYNIIQKYRKKHDEFELMAIKQILLKGISNNELNLNENQVDDVALGIAAAVKGLEIPFLIERQSNTIENKIDILLNLFFYGLLKK